MEFLAVVATIIGLLVAMVIFFVCCFGPMFLDQNMTKKTLVVAVNMVILLIGAVMWWGGFQVSLHELDFSYFIGMAGMVVTMGSFTGVFVNRSMYSV